MKIQWDNLSTEFSSFQKLLGEYLEGNKDRKTAKAHEILKSQWNKLISLHNEFDKMVEPLTPIALKSPFESPEFIEMWKLYKEYLEETHNQYIPSRRELIMLRRLNRFANGDEKRAINMLEYFICAGSKGIYKPTEKQLTGEEPPKSDDANQSDFDPHAKKMDI